VEVEETSGVEAEALGKREPAIRARFPSEVESSCLCHWEIPGNISVNRTIDHLKAIKTTYSNKQFNKGIDAHCCPFIFAQLFDVAIVLLVIIA